MKKMRNVLLSALVAVMALTFIAPVSFAVDANTGLKFASADPAYVSVGAGTTVLPQTFEATVSFPANTSATTRGGVILGCYETSGVACFNFEIKTNGNPRVYIVDNGETKTTYDATFTGVNVYTGNPVHIAITFDSINSKWYCFVDGVLKQTIDQEAPAVFELNKTLCLGGDLRTGNAQYFKGTIHNIAFYSDVRTAQEIASDANGTVDTNGLTHYYDLSGITAGDMPAYIASPNGKGPNFQKGRPGEDPAWWIYDKEPVTDYAYSFAIVGDPQIMNLNQPEKMAAMYQWIADNKEAKNIQYCLTMGDLTDDNTKAEYDRIEDSFKKLDAVGLPYAFVRGNHDKEANFDTYITYAEHGNKVAESGSFDGTMKNTWQKLTVGKVKYLFINVDYQNTFADLVPISEFIARNRDYNVIVSTHVYMGNNGKLLQDMRWEQTDNNEYAGADLWDQLVSKHDNIVLMLCGHAPSAKIVRRTTPNINGVEIPQILVDCQDEDEKLGGLGMVAMFYFSEDGSKLQVEHYSVDRKAYYRAESQFSMELNTVNADGTVNTVKLAAPSYDKLYEFGRSTVRNTSGALSNIGTPAKILPMLTSEYDAGYRNTKIEAYHSGFSTKSAAFNISTDRLLMGYTAYAKADPKWVAIRLRAPGAGTYEVSITSDVVSSSDKRTGAPMNAYLIPASRLPANPTTDDYAALRTDTNKIGYYAFGTGNVTGNYGIHTLGEGDYILILEGAATVDTAKHANNFYIKNLELKAVVASIGTNYYTSLNAAFEAAQVNDTVKLERPYVGALDVPAGVSLDLNGNRCTATEYTATNNAEYIIDSKGNGILDVQSKQLFGANNGYLPLYNVAKKGYSLHKYNMNVPADDYVVLEEKTRFWFYISFEDKAVYDLIAAGDTGLGFGVNLAWGEKLLDVAFDDDLATRWAVAAKNNENVWLYVDIAGLSALGDETLFITPTIELDGHTYELTNGTVSYTIE